MKEVIDKLKFTSTKSLTRQVLTALENATLQIEAQAMRFINAKLPPIRDESSAIAERFTQNMHDHFDSLTTLSVKDTPELQEDEYDDLTLVDHDFLEAMIAMEGMVKSNREARVFGTAGLLTRLEIMFPNQKIDETSNPLDPEQIGDSFNEAIRPMGLKAHYLLTIYREFNKEVFHNFEDMLAEANDVLIEQGVLPNLDLKAKKRAERKAKLEANPIQARTIEQIRESSRKREQAGSEPAQSSSDMFAMMQTLIQGLAGKQGSDGGLPITGLASADGENQAEDIIAEQQDLRKQQMQLMNMLTNIQSNIIGKSGAGVAKFDAASITQSINEGLQTESKSGNLGEIDAQSSDVINLVTLLYQAIWKDASLPVVVKELIGRTQISIMKLALTDTAFFGEEGHPGRVILNEFAMAGIAWTETDSLEDDPTYNKLKDLVERILGEADITKEFLQGLINELRAFKAEQGGPDANLEQRIRQADDNNQQLDDVHEYVRQKIYERVLKGYLDPSIKALLDTHLHEFLVKLVLKEGAGGASWKPVMSTIDVLLWTVQAEKQAGDRERFEKINPRLLDNLEKALQIGGASKTKITKIMRQLKQVQEYSFHKAATADGATKPEASAAANDSGDLPALVFSSQDGKSAPLPRNDAYLRRVEKLPIGVWLEFTGTSGQPVRCRLAAKIDSIDKLFFVNGQGEKVAELTRMHLATELKSGSAKIVGEGSVVDRAMKSVISNLKEIQPTGFKVERVKTLQPGKS